MPRIPGINHRQAVRALKKSGFRVAREGRKHIVMSDGIHFITIPRNNPINAYDNGRYSQRQRTDC